MPLRRLLRSVVLVGAVAASAPCFTPGMAHATVAVALSLGDLVRDADHVVVADIVSAKSAWDARHETIVTTVELAVVESWKGDTQPAEHIAFDQPGGTVGDVTMTVAGLSSFKPGERAVMFLRDVGRLPRPAKGANRDVPPSPLGDAALASSVKRRALTVVGLAQGKRAMEAVPVDDRTARSRANDGKAVARRWMVHPPALAGLATVPRVANPAAPTKSSVKAPATVSDPGEVETSIPLDEMRARVRALLSPNGGQ